MSLRTSSKTELMILFAGQHRRADIKNRLRVTVVGERMGESSPGAYTSPYIKPRASGNLLYDAGNPKQYSVIT